MGKNRESRLPKHLRQQRNENPDSHCYGLDRYSWNQGQNAKYDFQIFEDIEPGIVARGGSSCICYQERIGALCATDYKGVRNQMVMENKLIVCRKRKYTL